MLGAYGRAPVQVLLALPPTRTLLPPLLLLPLLPLLLLLISGPAVLSCDSKGRAVFKGCVLEAINGKSLDKRLQDDTTFCDVDFILHMLKQVGGRTVTWG